MAIVVADHATLRLAQLLASLSGEPSRPAVEVSSSASEGGLSLASKIASLSISGSAASPPPSPVPAAVESLLAGQAGGVVPLTREELSSLNAWLLPRATVLGGKVGSVDVVLYAAVAASLFPAESAGERAPAEAAQASFPEVARWYAHVRATADAEGLFPGLALSHVAFVEPQLEAAPKKAPEDTKAKGKAAPEGKAKGKAAPEGKAKGKAAPEGKAKGEAASASSPTSDDGPSTSTSAPASSDAAGAVQEGKRKEKKEKKEKKAKPAPAPAAEPEVDALDLVVGRIVEVSRHPNADALYVEKIDLGEAEPRQIVSGLVKFVPIEQMQERMVVVVANLKPAKMRDVLSSGMVLCASDDAHENVDPVLPPEGAAPGDRIRAEGYDKDPEAVLQPKKRIFEKVAPGLQSDAEGRCVYKGVPLQVQGKGICTAKVTNAHLA